MALSRRGHYSYEYPNFMLNYAGVFLNNPYDEETNPQGILNLGMAENLLLEDIIHKKLNEPQFTKFEPWMQYYFDFKGIPSFREALAEFLSSKMKAEVPLRPENLNITSGVGAALDLLSHALFDSGDCVLVPAPYYAAIQPDMGIRGGVTLIDVQISTQDTSRGTPRFCLTRKALEESMKKAKNEGKNVKGVLILNPNNPLGDVLDRETIKDILQFCDEFDLHAIFDEIYAFSVFDKDTTFHSVLSMPDIPRPKMTHFVWGFSKDFGLSGFRCGVIHTLVDNFNVSLTHLNYMAAVPSIIQDKLTKIIKDTDWIDNVFLPENHKRKRDAYQYCKMRLLDMDVEIHEPKAGFFIYANFKKYLRSLTSEEEMELFEELLDASVYLVPGSALFCQTPGWMRVTFTTHQDKLKLGLDRLEKVLLARRAQLLNLNNNGNNNEVS